MIDLIRTGGPLFTIPQTILALAVIGLVIKNAIDLRRPSGTDATVLRRRIGTILQIGIFCLFLGVLSQTISLVEALNVISAAGGVSPSLVIQGIMVSLIAPLYGLSICLISLGAWFVLERRVASIA